MKLRMFSVFDKKANGFIVPFFMPENGMAIRQFGDMCVDKKHLFGAHPEDFTLHLLGFFDDNNGSFNCLKESEILCTGLEMAARFARNAEERVLLDETAKIGVN